MDLVTPKRAEPELTVAPSREDPLVAQLSAVVGGPAGSRIRAGRHGWWTAVRVLVVLAMAVLALGALEKEHCRAQGWSSPDQFFHGCYSDLPLTFSTSGLADGSTPYLDSAHGGIYLAQPVLTGLTMWAVAQVTPDGSGFERARWYFDLSMLLIAVFVVVLVIVTAASAGQRRPWDAAIVALCPLFALSAFVSFDLLAVMLASAGLLAWGRSRPLLAGVLLGLAVATRSYPAVLVGVLGLLALRSGRWREWLITAGASIGAVALVLLPWVVLNLDGVKAAYRSWLDSAAGYGSLWVLAQTLPAEPRPRWMDRLGLHPFVLSSGTVTMLAVLGLVLALIVGVLLALASDRRPRVAQLAFVVLAVVVLTGKAWPVQASLWLVPLAALARPRWRDQLIWYGCEATYFMGVWLYIAGQTNTDRGLPGSWYSLLVAVRAAGLLWLVACVVRDIRRPQRDVVRSAGEDDPLGGPFKDAPDALVVRFD